MKINFRNGDIQTVTINNYFGKTTNTGPLWEEIKIPCSKEFKELVDFVCKLTGQDLGELSHRYMVEGVTRDIKDVFSVEPYLDRRLKELLKS